MKTALQLEAILKINLDGNVLGFQFREKNSRGIEKM